MLENVFIEKPPGVKSEETLDMAKLADLDMNDSGFDRFAFSQEYAKSLNSIAQ